MKISFLDFKLTIAEDLDNRIEELGLPKETIEKALANNDSYVERNDMYFFRGVGLSGWYNYGLGEDNQEIWSFDRGRGAVGKGLTLDAAKTNEEEVYNQQRV